MGRLRNQLQRKNYRNVKRVLYKSFFKNIRAFYTAKIEKTVLKFEKNMAKNEEMKTEFEVFKDVWNIYKKFLLCNG